MRRVVPSISFTPRFVESIWSPTRRSGAADRTRTRFLRRAPLLAKPSDQYGTRTQQDGPNGVSAWSRPNGREGKKRRRLTEQTSVSLRLHDSRSRSYSKYGEIQCRLEPAPTVG